VTTAAAIKLQDIYHALAGLHKRERRKRLVALLGGQSKIAQAAGVDPATVCRVVAGWTGGAAVERADAIIREKLRQISGGLEDLWNQDGDSSGVDQRERFNRTDIGAEERETLKYQ
jgi:DNA-binding transcriptional regulator YdaS (Cro superfamily)